ncbi:hypothetical protein [Micromonospora sp. NPDC005172]|uniref:hypothetical protein n=1 Tax=Micromonospora sp. NPDC005172 TaxID=3156867 RepID=UPI00339FF140
MHEAQQKPSTVCGAYCVHQPDGIASPSLRSAAVAHAGADLYMSSYGFLPTPTVDYHRIVACPERGQRIAALWAAAPRTDDSALAAYRAFRQETAEQFAFLTRPVADGGAGIRVKRSNRDPYADASAMIDDLETRRRLRILATAGSGASHPFLSDEENDQFRAVHDFFGHASIGRGFDRHGEEAAWVKHSRMYTPLARLALTSETRGQNAAFIWLHDGQRFPDQKAVLLPLAFTDPWRFSLRPSRADER